MANLDSHDLLSSLSLEECYEKLLVGEPCHLHIKFQQDVWGDELSFHNWEHIINVSSFAKVYINYIREQIESKKIDIIDDPLRLISSFNLWKQQQNGIAAPSNITKITSDDLDQLESIIKIAILFHDTGNIAQLVQNGEQKVIFLEKYTSKEAENRSQEIAYFYLKKHYNLNDNDIKLILHLISQTTFQPSQEMGSVPFDLFMRVVDQLGGNLVFDENVEIDNGRRIDSSFYQDQIKKRVLGLLIEMEKEGKGNIEVDAYDFLNFLKQRGKQLLGEEEIVNSLFKKLNIPMPPEINVREWGKIKVYDFINKLKNDFNLKTINY